MTEVTFTSDDLERLVRELLIQFQGDPMLSTGAKQLAKDFTEEILHRGKIHRGHTMTPTDQTLSSEVEG